MADSKQELLLEVQIHPANIRHGVWYFFLTRQHVQAWIAGGVLAGLFLVGNLLISPNVLMDLWSRREYRALEESRAAEGVSLRAHLVEFDELSRQADELHVQMSRVYMAYGLVDDESSGQGGYPFNEELELDSIYAASVRRGGALEARIRERLRVLDTFIDEVVEFEAANKDQVFTTPSMSPLRSETFVLTSPFGTRRSPFTKAVDFHSGIDLAASTGTEIRAPAAGLVVFAGRYPLRQSVSWWRYGNMVALRNGERFVTLYGHCDEVLVTTGQSVKQGEVIATVGNTGWSTSPHLHYEVRNRGEDGELTPVDPRIYILDHVWRDEERLLVRARRAPDAQGFEPLPRTIGR